MTLTDLMPLKEWKAFETEIAQKFNIDVNLFDTAGIRITDFKNWVNSLCPAIKATDKGQSFICAVAHMNIAAQAMREQAPLIEECDGGLVKIVVPIFVHDEFVGAAGACGFIKEEGEIDSFLINKITDIDEERIETLSKDVIPFPAVKVEAIKEHLAARLSEIVADFEKRA